MAKSRIEKLVLIASSTGGPNALHHLIPYIEERIDAPVVIVQHMPAGFTRSLAERMNSLSKVFVSEARHKEVLEKGHVYIAKGGMHLSIIETDGEYLFEESDGSPINGLKPCADYTFSSVLNLPVEEVICVVLTGMGADACKSISKLKEEKSIYTITQDKASCVVYGMPKVVYEKGLSDVVLPLESIANEINKKVGVF